MNRTCVKCGHTWICEEMEICKDSCESLCFKCFVKSLKFKDMNYIKEIAHSFCFKHDKEYVKLVMESLKK